MKRLQLFTGCMFSGKTHALILATDRARALLPVITIKSSVDTRDGQPRAIVARTGLSLPVDVVTSNLAAVEPTTGCLYAVDEAQFFPSADLLDFFQRTAKCGAYLAVAGLDFDYARKPFGGVLQLASAALAGPYTWRLERLPTRCTHGGGSCPHPAVFTQRLESVAQAARAASSAAAIVAVGGAELYQPACELHHSPSPLAHCDWSQRDAAH